MGAQEYSWRHAQILTHHRALCSVIAALPKAEMCRILGENMQNTSCSAAGPKELGKLGVLKFVVFCSFCFTTTNPAVSSLTSALYSPDCHAKLCWKLLLLQSPIGGHHSFTQGSKARKHVIKHRNTALSRTKNSFQMQASSTGLSRALLHLQRSSTVSSTSWI